MAEETIQKLNIEVKVDWEKKNFELISADLGKVSEKIKETGELSNKSSINLNNLAKAFGLGAIASIGAYEAFRKVVDILKDGIKQAIENEIVLSKLSFRLSTLGNENIPRTTKSLEEWSENLSKITQFTQTETISALEQLIKYTGDIQSAQKLLISAIKLSTAEHKNLSEVVNELGTAIAMPEFGLRRLRREYGSLVGDAKNVSEAIENITNNLEKQQSQTLTLEQRWRKVQKFWQEDIIERAGKFWIPVLQGLIGIFEKLGDVLNDIWRRTALFWEKTIGTITMTFRYGLKFAQEYQKQIDKIYNSGVKERKKELNDFAKEFEKIQVKVRKDLELEERKKIEDKLTDYINKKLSENTDFALQLLEKEVEEYRKAGIRKELIEEYYNLRKQEILEREKDTTKKHLEDLSSNYEEYFKKVRETWGVVLDSIVSATKDGLTEMIDQGNITAESFEQIWERIKKAFINAITGMIAEYIAKMAVIGGISLVTGIPMGTVATGMGWGGKGLFGILGLQEGGIVRKPTVALLGEKGPEAVIPLNKTKEIGTTINIQVNAFDLRSISRAQLEQFIRQLKPVLREELSR